MKNINGFKITRLSMSGFKCFETDVSYDFGDMTFITASNSKGKSSIADAIAFAFVGTPFFGDRGLDRLQNRNTDEMTVSVDFIEDTGEAHNLTRIRKRDMTAIAYDGLTVRQADLTTAFGDKDIFLSILNPLYFINVLGDNGKGLLEKLLPAVKHEDILASLPDSSRDILAAQILLSPETFIKNHRGELKKLEETLVGYRSQKELLDYQREERTAKLNELRANIDKIAADISELIMIRDNNRDIAAEESAAEELRERRAELLSEAAGNSSDRAIQDTMDKIRATEKSITKQAAKQYISSYTAQIAEAESNLKVLYAEHNRLNTALENTVVGYMCPVCATEITDVNISAVKADLQQRLSAIINEGKAAKNMLTGIMSRDSMAKDEFYKQKAMALCTQNDELAELNQQLQELNIERELDKDNYGDRLSALEAQIADHDSRLVNGNWSHEQALQFAELNETKKGYEAQVEALSNIADYDYTVQIAEAEADIAKLKRLIAEAVQYMAKRIELMLGGLKMSNTEIILTELIKTTGEMKDCFRFAYDGRDYKCLSLSEKIRAGLDVAVLIQRLSGRNYPIFVDNGESICTFGKVDLAGQVIISRVVNNQALQVTYRKREPANTPTNTAA